MSERMDIVKREEQSPELTSQPRAQVVTPAVDIFENKDEILLHVDMPGVTKENVTIKLENDTLSMTGLRQLTSPGTARFEEFGDVEYRRSFSVPQGIDSEKVNAELKNGVLRLHLPKSDAVKPRKIEIK